MTDEQLQRLFASCDTDSSGAIDRSELTAAMTSMGEYENEQSVDEALAESDVDGNGQVDFEEFEAVIN